MINILTKGELETIYFGGGTPSLLRDSNMRLIFEELENRFEISKNKNEIEISFEVEPVNVTQQNIDL